MNDDLDFLERRWRETGDREDQKRFLIALVASGKLDRQRLKMAAALGHAGASATGLNVPVLPEHYRSKVQMAAALLTHQEAVAFASDCALRVLPAWESVHVGDQRPRAAVEATRLWLSGQQTKEGITVAVKAAATAGTEADDPEQVPANSALTSAISAADSASHAALAAEYASKLALGQDPGVGGVEDCVAWAANFACSAALDPQAERTWQIARLAKYLLGRAETLAKNGGGG